MIAAESRLVIGSIGNHTSCCIIIIIIIISIIIFFLLPFFFFFAIMEFDYTQTNKQGCIIVIQGYILGGALVYPASKFPLLRVEYFCQFPYLLPCLVGAALGILTILG